MVPPGSNGASVRVMAAKVAVPDISAKTASAMASLLPSLTLLDQRINCTCKRFGERLVGLSFGMGVSDIIWNQAISGVLPPQK